MRTQEEDWEEQRQWREEYDRRFAARVDEQKRLHEFDPECHSLLVPADDEEFGADAYTAGWRDEEPHEPEPGFVIWDGRVRRRGRQHRRQPG